MGGNVGLSTPYQEILSPVEPEYPSLQNLYGESPMYVNGHRASITVDGFEVSYSQALSMAQAGALAIEGFYNLDGRLTSFHLPVGAMLGNLIIPTHISYDGREGRGDWSVSQVAFV